MISVLWFYDDVASIGCRVPPVQPENGHTSEKRVLGAAPWPRLKSWCVLEHQRTHNHGRDRAKRFVERVALYPLLIVYATAMDSRMDHSVSFF